MAADSLVLLVEMMPDVPRAECITALGFTADHVSPVLIGAVAFPQASALLAAHWLTLKQRARSGLVGAGAITSQSGSKVTAQGNESGSVGFSTAGMRKGSWSQTHWGVELSELVRRVMGPSAMVASVL